MNQAVSLDPLEKNVAGIIDQLKQIKDLKANKPQQFILSLLDESEEITQMLGYANVCILDMSVIGGSFGKAVRTWEKIFYVKTFYLLVYESLETWKYHGGKMSKLIKQYTSLENEFKSLTQLIKDFKKEIKYDDTVYKARHRGAAHISKEFLSYIEAVSNFNMKTIEKGIIDYMDVLLPMQTLMYKLQHLILKKIKDLHSALNVLTDLKF